MNLEEFTKYFLKNKYTMLCPICSNIFDYKININFKALKLLVK